MLWLDFPPRRLDFPTLDVKTQHSVTRSRAHHPHSVSRVRCSNAMRNQTTSTPSPQRVQSRRCVSRGAGNINALLPSRRSFSPFRDTAGKRASPHKHCTGALPKLQDSRDFFSHFMLDSCVFFALDRRHEVLLYSERRWTRQSKRDFTSSAS